jgi:hypothetical protein
MHCVCSRRSVCTSTTGGGQLGIAVGLDQRGRNENSPRSHSETLSIAAHEYFRRVAVYGRFVYAFLLLSVPRCITRFYHGT